MNLWPVEHFFPHFLTGLLCTQSKPVKKWGKKVFNWSEVHFYQCDFLQNPYFVFNFKFHVTCRLTTVFDKISYNAIFDKFINFYWHALFVKNVFNVLELQTN